MKWEEKEGKKMNSWVWEGGVKIEKERKWKGEWERGEDWNGKKKGKKCESECEWETKIEKERGRKWKSECERCVKIEKERKGRLSEGGVKIERKKRRRSEKVSVKVR